MPTGTYLRYDPHDGAALAVERFSCAPGPAGWRYTASVHDPATDAERGRVDVTVDSRWQQIRVEVRAGSWSLRGGVAGREVLWVRAGAGGVDATEHAEQASGFWGASPAFAVTAGRRLGLAPGEAAAVGLVAVSGDALAARTTRQRWTLVEVDEHPTDLGPLRVERFEVADLDTGEVIEVALAGDVVLAAAGVELVSLEGPPTLDPSRTG
jgi:hypothetical protein